MREGSPRVPVCASVRWRLALAAVLALTDVFTTLTNASILCHFIVLLDYGVEMHILRRWKALVVVASEVLWRNLVSSTEEGCFLRRRTLHLCKWCIHLIRVIVHGHVCWYGNVMVHLRTCVGELLLLYH